MAWLNLMYRFLRLGPLGLGVIAVAVLVLGFYLQLEENKENALRAAALAAGPPAAVDIGKFNRDRDMTDMREVVLRAQPIMDMAYRLTLRKDSGDDHVFMIPLVSEQSNSETEIVGMAYFPSETEDFDNITPELLMSGAVGFGGVAPLIEYNGRLGSMAQWDKLTEESFFDENLTMPKNPIIVWPYPEGRAEMLAAPAADIMTLFGLFSKIAGVIGLLALAKLVINPQAKQDQPLPAVQDAAVAVSEPARIVPRRITAVPLWKQRSGLVSQKDIDAQDHTENAAAFENTAAKAAEIAKPSSKFGMRKIVVGLVGGLFVLGLVSVISDLVAKSAPAEVAQIQTIEQRVATVAADAIVPDADPNRHWTDIDVTPIVEWFSAKFLLAVAGDADAQLLLVGLSGGLVALMVTIRFFFSIRRAMRPKTTASFSSMGIN